MCGALPSCSSKGSGGAGGAGGGGSGGSGGAGGSSGAGGTGGTNIIPIDATAMEIAATVCAKAYQCCTAAQLAGNSFAGMTEPECEASTAQSFRSLLQSIQASQNANRTRYEQSKVDACLTTIRTSSCAMLNVTNHLTGVPNCGSLTTPLVATGGACTDAFECIDGVCQKPAGSVDGTCGPGAAVGQSCAAQACAPALICDPGDSVTTETDDVCAQPKDDGTACASAVQCRSRNCAAPAAGGATTCMAGNQCFYSSACAAAGTPPSAATLLIAGVLLAAAAVRARARRRSFRAPASRDAGRSRRTRSGR
jgi:hypothetical protein